MADYVNDPVELVRRLNRYAYSEGVDPELAAKLQTIPGVAADVITNAAEILYSYRDELNDRGLRIMGQLFTYAQEQGWGSFNRDGRSKRIAQGVDFALGERSTKPAGVDPAPEVRRRDGFDWRDPDAQAKAPSPDGAPVAPVPPAPDGPVAPDVDVAS